ncbi:hypothetical protein [Streptomyces sp. NPDC054975]
MTAPFEWTGLAPALTSVVIPGLAAAVHLYVDRRRSRGGTERPATDPRDAPASSTRESGHAGAAPHVTVEVVVVSDGACRPSSAKEHAPW